MEKWSSILDKNVSDTPMSVLIESQQKELISDTESRDENNRRMIETYHSLLNNELIHYCDMATRHKVILMISF